MDMQELALGTNLLIILYGSAAIALLTFIVLTLRDISNALSSDKRQGAE
jgi:hypothetical protein